MPRNRRSPDFVRRWDEDGLVEAPAGRPVQDEGRAERRAQRFIDANAPGGVRALSRAGLLRALGALEQVGAINFDVLRLLLGPRLIDRWEMWKPSIDAMPGDYPMFRALVAKMRAVLDRS